MNKVLKAMQQHALRRAVKESRVVRCNDAVGIRLFDTAGRAATFIAEAKAMGLCATLISAPWIDGE